MEGRIAWRGGIFITSGRRFQTSLPLNRRNENGVIHLPIGVAIKGNPGRSKAGSLTIVLSLQALTGRLEYGVIGRQTAALYERCPDVTIPGIGVIPDGNPGEAKALDEVAESGIPSQANGLAAHGFRPLGVMKCRAQRSPQPPFLGGVTKLADLSGDSS